MGELDEILRLATERKATDVHIQLGLPPTLRIQSDLQTGAAAGVVTMKSSLKALIDRGLITEEDALEHAFDQRKMGWLPGRSRP